MKNVGGYQTRNLGAQAREGYDGTEQIVDGHIVRNYGGGGGLLMLGLAIITGGAALAMAPEMMAGEALGGLSAAGAEFGTAAAFDAAAAAETGVELATAIDTTANVLDTVDTVSEVADVASEAPIDTPFDSGGLPSDVPVDTPVDTPIDTPVDTPVDTPINDGGLPPVDEGPMGPPAPDAPSYDPNGLEDPTKPPYDPNGLPNTAPPNPAKPPKIPSQITNVIKKMVAPTPTQPTRALGTSNQSALGASCNQVKGSHMPSFLCNQADLLTSKGAGYKGGLGKLQQITGAGALASGSAAPVCMYAMQDQMNAMGQAPIGSGLGYASGGSAADTWKQAFCEKNLKPDFVCDKPYLLSYQNAYQHRGLLPLKHIYPPAVSGYAQGGKESHGDLSKYHAAAPKGHNPKFITGLTGYYACGGGTGQSDDIPAMLHDGDYVMDAETVSALGDGSSKAGKHVLDGFRTQIPHKAEGGSNPVPAKIADGEYVFPEAFVTSLGGGDNKRGAEILDGLRTKLRAHKRGAPLDKIPPKAKDPIDYIKKAKV